MKPCPIGSLAGSAGIKALRVLHVINTVGPGGAEKLLYKLVTRPSDIRHEVIVLGGRDRYSDPLEEHGVTVHHFGKSSLGSVFGGFIRLNRLVRNIGPDVVQTWMYRSNVLGGLVARAAGIPVVWGIHCSSLGPLALGSKMIAYLSGLLAPRVPDYVINCSARSVELHRRLGYRSVPGSVIPNGYDVGEFGPDDSRRQKAREELGIPPETFLIGTIARWHPQKGIPILLVAAKMVRDRGAPLVCLLVGRGLDAGNSRLSALIAENGDAGLVRAIGERSDIPEIARALDFHVLASIGSEAFPNVVAETMLSGTPNVVTDVGDSAMMVDDTGWVVPPGDVARLADAIERAWRQWSDQPAEWEHRRRSARERIGTSFTLDRMAEAYESVWKKLAQSSAKIRLGGVVDLHSRN